jgi:hypothetical protein
VKVVWWFLHLQNRDSQKAIVSQWFSALTAISVTRDFLFFLVLESERRALCMLGKHLTTELHPQATRGLLNNSISKLQPRDRRLESLDLRASPH